MIGTILLFSSILFYFSYLIISERKLKTKAMQSYSESLRLKRQGDRCYSCGYDISEDSYKFDIENFKLCDSCRRDESLRSVLYKWPSFCKFDKFILSKKFDRFLIKILIGDILFILIAFLVHFYFRSFPNIMNYSNYVLCFYWVLNNYRSFVVYRNKQKKS